MYLMVKLADVQNSDSSQNSDCHYSNFKTVTVKTATSQNRLGYGLEYGLGYRLGLGLGVWVRIWVMIWVLI